MTREQVEGAMKQFGLRMTKQRRIVLDHIESMEDHPTARDIFGHVKGEGSSVAITTVYNTLRALVRLGFIKVLEFDSHENRYEANMEPHVNLICLSCGKIEDREEVVPGSLQGPARHGDFAVTDCRHECYGYCRFCQDGM